MGISDYLWRATYLSWLQPGLFGEFPWEPFGLNSVECNPVSVLKVLLGGKRRKVRTPSRPSFGDFMKIAFIYFRKFSLIRSPHHTSNILQ